MEVEYESAAYPGSQKGQWYPKVLLGPALPPGKGRNCPSALHCAASPPALHAPRELQYKGIKPLAQRRATEMGRVLMARRLRSS